MKIIEAMSYMEMPLDGKGKHITYLNMLYATTYSLHHLRAGFYIAHT